MNNNHDLELILKSHIPIVVIETHEEKRVLNMLTQLSVSLFKPLFHWTVTEGLERCDIEMEPQRMNARPEDVLRHIKSSRHDGLYVLSDFHHYLAEPIHIRLLKDIALEHSETGITIILMSHELEMPPELKKFSAGFNLALPTEQELEQLVRDTATDWSRKNPGKQVRTDRKTLDALLKNLAGLTLNDARRLARKAIYDDGAITESDLNTVMQAKYDLLNNDGVLSFEFDTASFAEVGGLRRFKSWLEQRHGIIHGTAAVKGLDTPRGALLLGVQGCGKSLAAKAVAGIWQVPLLRLDFGALYNKYHGESERNLRESLKMAEVMAPCVLWLDEIEKGLAVGDNDGGTSRRMLGTLLTWMAEKTAPVFMVATANDIERLPPELVRKGRFDEIFFVDLPGHEARRTIFEIHLAKRDADPAVFDLEQLVAQSDGFSGAEIEQAVVSAMYSAHAQDETLATAHLLHELATTRPLSVTMAERINTLRHWAADRAVPGD
ncbi:MAG: AAA family ATPase [Granulosicoccaceae bacterium]|jgi:SpoVK/Ycf46/Vps4 family AAA+-type ATPase